MSTIMSTPSWQLLDPHVNVRDGDFAHIDFCHADGFLLNTERVELTLLHHPEAFWMDVRRSSLPVCGMATR